MAQQDIMKDGTPYPYYCGPVDNGYKLKIIGETMAQQKEEQKKLIIEIMEADAKDGLYKQQIKTYRKISTVQAKLFEEGDEDGFIIRYYDDEDVDEDGTIHTSDIIGKNKIKVPYVSTLENQKHLSHGFGKEYLCIGIKGERWLVDKYIFELTYELVNK